MLPSPVISLLALSIISFNNLVIEPTASLSLVSEHTISLENRQNDRGVNEVFKDNILLNYAYLSGGVTSAPINWDEVRRPSRYEFSLKPGETFAFHGDALPEYRNKVVRTSNAHFNGLEGFKSDGYLMGDGVCHFASLIYWVASDAGLDAKAPTNHNFAKINGISREYGVSIYNSPNTPEANARQNLYVTNNFDKTVTFVFEYNGTDLSLKILK